MNGEETKVITELSYTGVDSNQEIAVQHLSVIWCVTTIPDIHKAKEKITRLGAILDKLEQAKVIIRTKVDHLFRWSSTGSTL